ncbi:MAG: transcription antitermination factor NusB [Treponemataceae bacterium]
MTRHESRVVAVQILFAWDISQSPIEYLYEFSWFEEKDKKSLTEAEKTFIRLLVAGTIENLNTVDDLIKKFLTTWDFDRISKIYLAILRLSTYSLLFQTDIHSTIIINEAIDIAKDFAIDDSYKFINAILDNIKKSIKRDIE